MGGLTTKRRKTFCRSVTKSDKQSGENSRGRGSWPAMARLRRARGRRPLHIRSTQQAQSCRRLPCWLPTAQQALHGFKMHATHCYHACLPNDMVAGIQGLMGMLCG
jgi:hypothetical protein